MIDRELLELAAKAAGLTKLTCWSEEIRDYDSPHYGMAALHASGCGGECGSWNPLEDDGDALRLAVKLRIAIHYEFSMDKEDEDVVEALVNQDRANVWRGMSMGLSGDANVAVRTAIVRAAAEIGKGM
ncbi:hypothetical protein [Pandoraea sputorum]|uniref:DUF2591 domain-containing protein n=1 Tax=Pandoraea sputorum TaxID=93222 RepID=A0A5E5BCP8_9BURK|nr:hypothetical protein [Pandoraea sputorum]VVE82872.1 hypothetical protein PSP31121_04010 [Pandoraea sputorum]